MDPIGSEDFRIFIPVQNASYICDAHVNMAVDLDLDAFALGVYPMGFSRNVDSMDFGAAWTTLECSTE